MNNQLLVLTASPASGKTHLISELISNLREIPLVISPLRALANECLLKWAGTCDVMTPEEWLKKSLSRKVVILDEFHLFFYWGDSFRPQMWEAFYAVVEQAETVILLTATLTQEMIEEIKKYSCHFQKILWVDHGNQILKNKPARYLKAPNERWLKELILESPSDKSTNLIFCAYRSEVFKWEKELKARGFRVWTCVGGEASLFSLKVQSERAPQFIVATTVLSHGVNLPNISRIFLMYQIKNLDFWIQMVARGGRRGEAFEVFALEKPIGLKYNRPLNSLAILHLSLRMRVKHFTREIQEWFLKA